MPLTPNSQLDLAFDPALIPQQGLPDNLHVRPLAADDYDRGHLDVLADLTKAPDVGRQAWQERFRALKSRDGTYFPIVFLDRESDRIVAAGTLVVELKFLRGNGIVGHIEDIVVHKSGQGNGLGKRIIQLLTSIGEQKGCYKVILDCSPENEAFYAKCGYKNAGVEMAKYM